MSSYEAWLQWMTTSSPGCHLVTPSPTFHTMPEASEPPMWWSSFGWERNTDTGLPSAAHTLLKFTPAAMTRTVTSKAPGSGTSISSSWKASSGSPRRSPRITPPALGGGGPPGSPSSCATCFVSIATAAPDSGGRMVELEPVLALDPEDGPDDNCRHHETAHAVDQEGVAAVDVAHEPAEVLAEEAGHQGPREEERAADREPRRHRVEAVLVGVEVGRGERGEVLVLAGQRAGGLAEMVPDVAQVLARALREAGEVEDHLRAGLEAVALRDDPPGEPLDVLLQAVGIRELPLPRATKQNLALDRVDALLEQIDDGVEGVRQDVEDLVDDVVLGLRVGRVELVMQAVELGARRAPDGDDERAGDVDVDLDGLERRLGLVPAAPHGVEDEQQVVAVGVELRALVELDGVLQCHRVQAEDVAERQDLLRRGVREVQPEELVALPQLGEAGAVDGLEHLHVSREPTQRGSVRSRDASGQRLPPRADLAAGLPAPGRSRRDRGPARRALPRPGRAQADRARVRACAARGLARLLRAAGPGAAPPHLGSAPPGLQRPRPRRRARPLPHAVAVRERDDDRRGAADRRAELGAREAARRRRAPRGARPPGRP